MKSMILFLVFFTVFINAIQGKDFYMSASLGYAAKGMGIIDLTFDNNNFGIFINGASNVNNYANDDGFVNYQGDIPDEQVVASHHYKYALSFGAEKKIFKSLWLRAGLSASMDTYYDEFIDDDYDTHYREENEKTYDYGLYLGASYSYNHIVLTYQYTDITGHGLMIGYRLHL